VHLNPLLSFSLENVVFIIDHPGSFLCHCYFEGASALSSRNYRPLTVKVLVNYIPLFLLAVRNNPDGTIISRGNV
jgi:hypothetical protein